jgi:rod shape-determining protein MreC
MSRVVPTRGTKTSSFLFICLSALLIYIDITYKSFEGIKNSYKSIAISSTYLLKAISIDPFYKTYKLFTDKSQLIKENKELKLELDKSYLSNFIMSADSKFFADDKLIKTFLERNEVNNTFYLAKIKSFDSQLYFCCAQHRLFLEILNKPDIDFIGGVVINSKGIVGQIINDKGLQETLLLTDVEHVIPIFSGQYFCNAKGSGTPEKISCTYSSLIWPSKIIKGQSFYSSGLGGVYPRGILIGHVSKIENIDDTLIRLEINLVSSPIQENTFGVLEP